MAYKRSEASKYSENCKLLVKAVTKFDKTDENFTTCYDHLLSTLLYHTYKEANSHEAMHIISKFHEKFLIQSELEKANRFKKVSDNLINFFNNEGKYQREKGFRILSLLLHLSQSKITDTILLEKDSTCSEETWKFDWASYLREDDINCNFPVESDSEFFSSDESASESASSDDDSVEDLPDPVLRAPPRDDSGLGISPDSCSGTSQLFHATSVVPENISHANKQERNQNTCYPYWLSQYQKMYGVSPYQLKSINFTKIWDDYLASQSLTIEKNVIVHERNVVKEILWMFCGVQNLFIAQSKGKEYIPNCKVHLCNLTSLGLGAVLSEFCTYARKRSTLHDTAKTIIKEPHNCLTYQAYGESLRKQLQIIERSICDMDKILRKGNETFTLMILQNKMKPLFHHIDLLYKIYAEVDSELSSVDEPHVRACLLLNCLWNLLLNQSIQDQSSNSLNILLRMFLETCKPYISFLEDLIILGSFNGSNKEFFIWKKDVSGFDETYWETSFGVRQLPRSENFFMKPFITDMLSAGKSLEILNKINSSLKIEPFRLDAEKGELYLKFIQILQRLLSPKRGSERSLKRVEQKEIESDMTPQEDPMLTQQLFPFCSETAKFFQPDVNPVYKPVSQKPVKSLFTWQQELIEKVIESLNSHSLKPVTLSITKALRLCMVHSYNPICKRLIKAFKEDFEIIKHMTVMRKYFLMESGDVMYNFYSEIFWKIFKNQNWQDIASLCSALENAILENKDNCKKLDILLIDAPDRIPQHSLSHLSLLKLSYNVKWPITMILGSSVQAEYNQIFNFLLQIKCAKFLLDNLYSLSLSGPEKMTRLMKAFLRSTLPREQKMHGMHIIRMKLMFFVNGLHNYIMTGILHSSGIELHNALQRSESLEEMIQIHKRHFKTLIERCLLTRRIAYIKDHIFEVLNLCYVFQQLWLKGVDNVNVEDLRNIEQKFSKINNILTCCLNKPLRRGTNLDFETLGHMMLSSSHSLHFFGEENCY
ncbi:gamma-tubulin complex component 5 isoform X2 [Parasteatoda tepidariorum]|uniref:gamma-tubulin complex component 5 isoform X2 n=1 Tax=Parasteatoda tepidariorum TaxID=114398 RepID=UPI001C71A759|nr:gamma-tubulin complex component 5 [Parasteatoda tepidariorum]